MSFTRLLLGVILLFHSILASTLVVPPKSVMVVAFEDVYEMSLLANTMSDLMMETTLVISSQANNELFEKLVDVEVIKVNTSNEKINNEISAMKLCENFLTDTNVSWYVDNVKPTFIVFPAVR